MIPKTEMPRPQVMRWVSGKKPGAQIDGYGFIPWKKLVKELEGNVLTGVSLDLIPGNSKAIMKDLDVRKNFLIRIINPEGNEIGGIWIGVNPEKPGVPFDGLIRVGESYNPPIIWAVFQRFSDGSYRRQMHKPYAPVRYL